MTYSLEGIAAVCSLFIYILIKWQMDSSRNARNDHRIEVMEKQVQSFHHSLEELKKVVHQEQLDTRKAIHESMSTIQKALNSFELTCANHRVGTRKKTADIHA